MASPPAIRRPTRILIRPEALSDPKAAAQAISRIKDSLANSIDAIARSMNAPSIDLVAASYVLNPPAQTIPTGVEVIVNFPVQILDTHNAVTVGASWKFTAPVAGLYHVSAGLQWSAPSVANYCWIGLFKNGTSFRYGNQLYTGTSSVITVGSWLVQLAHGDTLSVTATHNTASSLTVGLFNNNAAIVGIYRVPGS